MLATHSDPALPSCSSGRTRAATCPGPLGPPNRQAAGCGATSSLGKCGDSSAISLGHRALGGARDVRPPSGAVRVGGVSGLGAGRPVCEPQLSLGTTVFVAQ